MHHRVVATAGHVDHGKSTLVRALTGMEPDRLDEERRRGLTIELGFVWTELAGTPDAPAVTVAFVDVPGHQRFTRTMLAGTGAAPAALLVVAADDGWSAQSSEHRDILHLLDVPAVAVVVSKAGLVGADRIREVRATVDRELDGTSLAGAPTVVVDAVGGDGLDRLREILVRRLSSLPEAEDHGRPRLWVDRAFSVVGTGTVVTGTLAGGALAVGDRVEVAPLGRVARVRGLQSLGRPADTVGPGSRVAVNLAGVDSGEVSRGDAVLGGGPWQPWEVVDAVVTALPGQVVDRTGSWHLHVGTADITCRVLPVADPVAGPAGHAARDAGSPGAVRLLLDRPLPLTAGDRFVLREAGRRATVAGGIVVEPGPVVSPRGRRLRAERATHLVVAAQEDRGVRLRALLASRGGVDDESAALAAAGWSAEGTLPPGVRRVGQHVALDAELDRWATAVGALGPGVHDRGAVVRAVGSTAERAGPGLAGDVCDHLVRVGVLTRASGGYTLTAHADTEAAARQRRAAALLADLEAEPFAPPDLDDRARFRGVDHREVNALVQRGDIVRVGKVAFARRTLGEAVARLEALEAASGPFTAAQAKEAWGTTRKYAIPLLEHLDALGVTSFDGNLRRVVGRLPSA